MFDSLAAAFSVTDFDIYFFIFGAITVGVTYYFMSLSELYESAFGMLVWVSIYLVLSVLLVRNDPLGTTGWLFPFWFAVFLLSVSVYLIYILALLFPLHGGLRVNEPESQTLYTFQFIFVGFFYYFVIAAILIYMIEQVYIFRVGSVFTFIQDSSYYISNVRPSWLFQFVMRYRDEIIPIAFLLMLYKLLFSNIITAALLSVWYNLSRMGFYNIKNDAHYRVEFHEVKKSEWGDTWEQSHS